MWILGRGIDLGTLKTKGASRGEIRRKRNGSTGLVRHSGSEVKEWRKDASIGRGERDRRKACRNNNSGDVEPWEGISKAGTILGNLVNYENGQAEIKNHRINTSIKMGEA